MQSFDGMPYGNSRDFFNQSFAQSAHVKIAVGPSAPASTPHTEMTTTSTSKCRRLIVDRESGNCANRSLRPTICVAALSDPSTMSASLSESRDGVLPSHKSGASNKHNAKAPVTHSASLSQCARWPCQLLEPESDLRLVSSNPVATFGVSPLTQILIGIVVIQQHVASCQT